MLCDYVKHQTQNPWHYLPETLSLNIIPRLP
jgi:hypothetical protein